MNLLVRVGLVAVGFGAVAVGSGPGGAGGDLVAAFAAGMALVGVVVAHWGWRRPWSDALAWFGAVACLVALGGSADGTVSVFAVGFGVALVAVGLHLPAGDAPRPPAGSALLNWSLVAAAVLVVAWGPLLLARGELVVLDPLTSTGMALRLAAAAVLVALLAVTLYVLRHGRRVAEVVP